MHFGIIGNFGILYPFNCGSVDKQLDVDQFDEASLSNLRCKLFFFFNDELFLLSNFFMLLLVLMYTLILNIFLKIDCNLILVPIIGTKFVIV